MQSRENDKTNRRLAELKRLILTSTSVEEEEAREREDVSYGDTSPESCGLTCFPFLQPQADAQDKTHIDPERSNYSVSLALG